MGGAPPPSRLPFDFSSLPPELQALLASGQPLGGMTPPPMEPMMAPPPQMMAPPPQMGAPSTSPFADPATGEVRDLYRPYYETAGSLPGMPPYQPPPEDPLAALAVNPMAEPVPAEPRVPPLPPSPPNPAVLRPGQQRPTPPYGGRIGRRMMERMMDPRMMGRGGY